VSIENLVISLVFLLATGVLAGSSSALLRVGRLEAEGLFKKHRFLFFFDYFLTLLFNGKRWEGVLFCLSFTKQIMRLCYAITALFCLTPSPEKAVEPLWILGVGGGIVVLSLLTDFLFDLIAIMRPELFFSFFAPLASLCLTLCLPCTLPFFKILKIFIPNLERSKKSPARFRFRDKISEFLQESELSPQLDLNEQKLILSVASFKERVAREVMVPRIDVFSLAAETPIQEAAKSFLSEGYSRIPVYRETIDHIIGVLLYKDVLKIYAQAFEDRQNSDPLRLPIEKLAKPVLYTPESKKISHLLQEFRNKQIHLAIVVDEYGGTEGIVTIEDILEELVGEIADEYDIEEEMMYSPLPGGGWIVDARMTIVDIEEDLGIKIPSSPEYDTIGGYIYHRAEAIPSKGWKMHHDNFDLEILSSDERSLDKIKIIPSPTS
jgi:putative hemolysin